MTRGEQVLRVVKASRVVEIEHLRCQHLGQRPVRTFRRHQAWIIPCCGFVAGFVAGSAIGRTTVSALLSTGVAAIRLQPVVSRFLANR